MLVLTGVSIMFCVLMLRKAKVGNLNRNTGIFFLLLYLVYIIDIGYRGTGQGLN